MALVENNQLRFYRRVDRKLPILPIIDLLVMN